MKCWKYLLAAPPSPVCSMMSSKMQMATRRSSQLDCSESSLMMLGSRWSKYGCSCDLRALARVPMHSLIASRTSLSASCSACSSSLSSSSKSSVHERSYRSWLRATEPVSTSLNCLMHSSSCAGSRSITSSPFATSSAGGASTPRHLSIDSSVAHSSSLSSAASTDSISAFMNAPPMLRTQLMSCCGCVFLALNALCAAMSSSGSVCAAAFRTSSWKKNLISGIMSSATVSMYG
mmetsp:Transcript_6081/g.24219  ORF Transcript_6081/g.24219 Transcript_6081/m.24219 type:complete len:234 (-) Transcript_6081:2180-2881(-)